MFSRSTSVRLSSVLFAAFALMAFSSSAVDWNLKSNSNGVGLSGSTWQRADDPSVTSTTLNSEDDYFILSGSPYAGSSDGQIFTGRSLTIGSLTSNTKPTLLHYYTKGIYGNSDLTFQNDGVILARGSWRVDYGNANQPHIVNGTVKLVADAATPFRFFRNGDVANGLKFMDKFWGDGAATIDAGTTAPSFSFALLGDYSEFSGTLTLQSDTTGATPRYSFLQLTSGTSSGTVKAASACRIAATDLDVSAGFGTFDLADGSVLEFIAKGTGATAGTREITNSKFVLSQGLSVAGTVKIEVAYDDSANGKFDDTLDLLTVPEGVSLNPDWFSFVPTDANHPAATFSVRDNADGTKTLVMTYVGSGAELLVQAEDGTNAKGMTGVRWSNGSTGTSSDYNYATVGYDIFISSSEDDSLNRFYGNSLRIGDAAAGTDGRLRHYGGKPVGNHQVPNFPHEGLVLACGYWAPRYGNPYEVSGKVKVTARPERPFRIYQDFGGQPGTAPSSASLTMHGPLSGSGALQIQAGVPLNASGTNFCVRLMGGAADFTGTIAVTSQVSNTGFDCHAGLAVTNGAIPGAVSVGHGSYLVAPPKGETTTFKALSLEDGSELIVKAGLVDGENKSGKLVATEAFDVTGVVRVNLTLTDSFISGGTLEILTIPAASAASIENFALATDIPTFYTGPLALAFRTDGATKTLILSIPEVPVVNFTGHDASTSQQTNILADSSFTNAANWSDGELPHEGAHYFCMTRTNPNADRILRTTIESIDYTFPGESISLIGTSDRMAAFAILYDSFTVPKMFTSGTTKLLPKYSGGMILNTTLTAQDGCLDISAYAGGLFTLNGELSGAAQVSIIGNGAGSGNPGGYVEFTGTNTNFTGKIDIYITPSERTPSIGYGPNGQRYFESVYVSDGRNLGGAMSPANPKGIILRDCSMVITRNSVTFDEPTRGWFVGLAGQFNVEAADHEFTLASPLAVDGTIYKRGAGCLTLANPQPTFGASATETAPDQYDPAKRTLVVSNGTLKIASANAVNGLKIRMDSPDARIVLDTETDDADLATNGFVNVLSPDMPFEVNAEAGVEKVRIELSCGEGRPTWEKKTVGICMVKMDVSSSFDDGPGVADLLDVKRAPGSKFRVERVISEPVIVGSDQYVAFKAILNAHPGFILIVK